MKADPLVQQGVVDDWEIRELDLIHAEKDNELVVLQSYR